MARIAGVNIADNKHVVIALTSIYGIGLPTSKKLCRTLDIDPATKVAQLTEAQLEQLRTEITKMTVEGDLRRVVTMNIKQLMELGVKELKQMLERERVDAKARMFDFHLGINANG